MLDHVVDDETVEDSYSGIWNDETDNVEKARVNHVVGCIDRPVKTAIYDTFHVDMTAQYST